MLNNKRIILVLILVVLTVNLVVAQNFPPLPPFADKGGQSDIPQSPINGLIGLGLLVGGFLGIKFLRNKDGDN